MVSSANERTIVIGSQNVSVITIWIAKEKAVNVFMPFAICV